MDYQEAYRQLFLSLGGDVAGRQAAQEYLDNSTAIYHDEVIGIAALPRICDMEQLLVLDTVASTTYSILSKVTRLYQRDAQYRQLFGFAPLLERLICLPTGYDSIIPIMRADIFLDLATMDFQFCEFNTDGTSAMNEDREGANALSRSATCQLAATQLLLQPQELFDNWVDGFLGIYAGSEQALSNPTVAIVDYAASGTLYEFEQFRQRFAARGLNCLVCDIPSLQWRDGVLYGSDLNPQAPGYNRPQRIDAIYRRAVSGEILAELLSRSPDCCGAHALLHAVEQQAVTMIGGFNTHVAHSKRVFAVLHRPETMALLSDAEQDFIRQHVPYTTLLAERFIDLEAVKEDKNHWIIKPEDGYAAKGVHAGRDYTTDSWATLIDELANTNYIAQNYAAQQPVPNTRLTPIGLDPAQLEPWNLLTGLYLYNGRLSGLYVRAGQSGLIAGFAGGITVPTLLAAYDPAAGLHLRTRDFA
ncbi:MAG: circularly permuted type 2 ATP-grasp protein [Coriobacteriales bacterium]|jgi:hypothetical protein|nr:circularly permuted type 2 ATP-grasp protein [Coriobacteriales bacterium]